MRALLCTISYTIPESIKKILISEINKYLCQIIQQMKNIHIIIAVLLVGLVVLYR
jgi:hypothetical protein